LQGTRNKLLNKCTYVSLHPPGEIVDNKSYWNLLEQNFRQDYQIAPNIPIFGSSDGASNLKTVIETAKAIHIYSKFHWKRRLEQMPNKVKREYRQEYRDILRNWGNKKRIGYWSESDLAHILKGFSGKGNRVLGLQAYRNLLTSAGVRLLN